MTPPINIDGSQVSGITIDGTSVSDVTVDGDTVFSAIPDTSVSRDPDDSLTSAPDSSTKLGIRVSTSQNWPEFDGEISQNTADATEAIIRTTESTPTVKDTVDISGLSAGDVFTFDNADLNANAEYDVLLTANSGWTSGFDDSPAASYTSADGNLEIISGVNDGGTIGDMHAVVSVGNLR